MGSLNFIPRLSDPPLTIFGSREAPTKYSSYLPSRRRITVTGRSLFGQSTQGPSRMPPHNMNSAATLTTA
ncbi:hypothetical protein HJC23_011092 [Cyclotella cryptica]|uniref:Uncharacterized protein n=1 Tax=Cyclotella cryptica TaxID=29204 RepID=A0ABD3P086_9STRA